MNREERLAKKQKEDHALNRVLWWFGGAVILEFFLLLLNRFGARSGAQGGMTDGVFRGLWIGSWVFLVAAVACGVCWALRRKEKGKTFLPGLGTLVFGSLFLCAFAAGTWQSLGVQFLYVCVPVVAVLALIYYLYQREFFLVALQGGLTLFAMWAYRKLIAVEPVLVYVLFAVAAALAVAFLVLAAVLQRGKGRLGKVRVLPKRANYLPLYAAGAECLVCLAVALLLGAAAAYVCLIATVAGLFGVAVYYTVRLM